MFVFKARVWAIWQAGSATIVSSADEGVLLALGQNCLTFGSEMDDVIGRFVEVLDFD